MAGSRIEKGSFQFGSQEKLPEERLKELKEIKKVDNGRLEILNRLSDLEAVLKTLESQPKQEQNGRKIEEYRKKIRDLKKELEEKIKQLKQLGAGWL